MAQTDTPTGPRQTPDLFAGPGGWDVAARNLGIPTIGFEADRNACETRRANGLATIEGDLTLVDPREHRGPGLIFSPPCQGFSTAGKGEARAETERLLALLVDVRTASDVEALIADVKGWAKHEGLWLVLVPLLWALRNCPSWLAGEQVPAVLPLWEAFAVILRRVGYSVATGYVYSETLGVPQTRKRAIIVARSPWMTAELGPARLPQQTHSRYNTRTPSKIEEGLPRWVSMAEVLGIDDPDLALRSNYGTGGDPAARGERAVDTPAATVTSKADRNLWRLSVASHRPNQASRSTDQPAATLAFGKCPERAKWLPADRVNNQSGTAYDLEEQVDQPATTLATRDLVGFRGANANRFNGSTKSRNDGIRLTIEEAACLQTFPVGYRWQGTSTAVFQQIGNAIPPLMAEAILAEVTGLPFDPSPEGQEVAPDPEWVLAAAGAAAERTSGQVPREIGAPAATITGGKGTAVWKRRGTTGTPRSS